jgi:hypothetical protein
MRLDQQAPREATFRCPVVLPTVEALLRLAEVQEIAASVAKYLSSVVVDLSAKPDK